jgi:pimeloyl-ACP methyl ester carboxylesterase
MRCIVPDLPLGSHRVALQRGADLTPGGVAALVAELLERLELTDVTLVGNDTGGALCQLVAAEHPERLGRLVLTNCDAFEHFPPPAIKPLVWVLARVPGAVGELAQLGRLKLVRRWAMRLAPLTVEPIGDELLKSWLAPMRGRAVRRDVIRFMRAIDPQLTLDAAERLRSFDRPALVVWGERDRFFPVADGERLAATLPHARLELIDNARTFVQLDAPEQLAALIEQFVGVRSSPDGDQDARRAEAGLSAAG